jgi:hypothetical protein
MLPVSLQPSVLYVVGPAGSHSSSTTAADLTAVSLCCNASVIAAASNALADAAS